MTFWPQWMIAFWRWLNADDLLDPPSRPTLEED